MSVFSIEEVSAQEIRLTIDGSLSGEPFEDLQKNLDRLLEKLHPVVTLDLSRVHAMSSSSIGKLLLFHRTLQKEKRELRIRGCSAHLFRIFEITTLGDLVSISKNAG